MKHFTPPTGRRTRQAILLSALLAAAAGAHAAGTDSGTVVANMAKLSYSVGGTAQEEVCSSTTGNSVGNGGTSGTTCLNGTNGAVATDFAVDNKVDVLVTEGNSASTTVSAGQTAVVTTFTVKNEGNTPQDFALAAANLGNGTTLFTKTDNFDGTGCAAYVESGASAGYLAAEDTATHIDALAAEGTQTVYVVCSIPVGQANDSFAAVSLTATARADDGAATLGGALSEAANTEDGVEIVFGDSAGSDDAAEDAKHSARDAYFVQTAQLTVTKTLATVCDPYNGATDAHNIPGALVKWSITVSNAATAGASATLAQITDALNANTTFDADFELGADAATCVASANAATSGTSDDGFRVSCSGTGNSRVCATTPQWATTSDNNDEADLNGTTVEVNFSQALPAETGYAAGELKPGESVNVQFQVFIN